MKDFTVRSIQAGDRIESATHNQGTVRLGDAAPVFVRPTRAGDKTDATETHNSGKVQLGDAAPVFVRAIQAGDKAHGDAATQNAGKVRLGDAAPVFGR